MFNYKNVFKLLQQKNISTYRIRKEKIIGEATLTKLRHNKCVSTKTIYTLCKLLDCKPNDIMEMEDE